MMPREGWAAVRRANQEFTEVYFMWFLVVYVNM